MSLTRCFFITNFMQIDEVRYMEDLEELGINWIRMGLQDVLYDPASGEIFTPNTGVMTSLGKMPLNQPTENGKIEPRANKWHDPKTGRFMEAPNKNYTLMDGGAFNEAENSKRNRDGAPKALKADKAGGGKSKKSKSHKSTKNSSRPRMSRREVRIVSSGILTDHPNLKPGSKRHFYEYGDNCYIFSVNGPGSYNFHDKLDIEKNYDLIKAVRKARDNE